MVNKLGNKLNTELLAPAGDLEKLKIAIEYGADAVYFGGHIGSLRAAAGNLTVDEIGEGVEYAHHKGKKAYQTVNIYPHNEDVEALKNYIRDIKDIPIDAFLVSDPGLLMIIKEIIPNAEFHLSTQANTTNYMTANFWHDMGVKRIVLARELTLDEIREIRENVPDTLELEAFVHGAMCISYSGRCILSNALSNRDSNRGACSHPCRWQYRLVEEQRPGEYFPIEEDEQGTYILNSKDICMINHIQDIIDAGVYSLKIEGRMKSIYYIATVIRAYRHAIDNGYSDQLMAELLKASHREFSTGFFYNKVKDPNCSQQEITRGGYIRGNDFLALVLDYDPVSQLAKLEQRNKFSIGDRVEIFGPDIDYVIHEIREIYDEDMNPIEAAPHAQQIVYLKIDKKLEKDFFIRAATQI